MAIIIPGSGEEPEIVEVTYKPLTGPVEFEGKFHVVARWESDGGPNRIQLLRFDRESGALSKGAEVDLDEVLEEAKIQGYFLYSDEDPEESELISGQIDVNAGVNSKRIIGNGAARRLEPVLLDNILWFGINGYLLAFDLRSGNLAGKVTGEEGERQSVYFTPIGELGGKLLCVFERVKGQVHNDSVLQLEEVTGSWVIDAWLQDPTLGAGEAFNGWLDGSPAIELGLCTVDLGGIVAEKAFPESEELGWGSSGTTEAIRVSDSVTANQGQFGPTICNAGGGTNYDVYSQEHHFGEGVTYEVPHPPWFGSIITNPNLEEGDTVLRYWEYSDPVTFDYSYEVNNCAYDVKESKSIMALYGTFISGGLKFHWNYFDPSDYENWESWDGPIGPGGIHPGPAKAHTSGPALNYGEIYPPVWPGSDPPEESPLPPFTVRRKTWVNAGPKPRFEVLQTTPPGHSTLDVCRATTTIEGEEVELAIFGPRETYTGPNFTWDPEGYHWAAYDENLDLVWEQTIEGSSRRQSRPVVAGGRVWTAIDSGLVELRLEDGEILRETSWSSLGVPTDDWDKFELISDGISLYLRAATGEGGEGEKEAALYQISF